MTVEIIENRDQWYREYQDGWLAHYRATGETKWDIYNKPVNKTPPTGKGIDLSQSRLVLVSSAGSYLKASQQPYDDADDLGDYTTRRYPTTTPFDAIAYAHSHYDHAAVNADPQVLLPLKHLADVVEEGGIGELAPDVISFHGYQPDVTRVADETIPAIVAAAKEMNAQAALLVPS